MSGRDMKNKKGYPVTIRGVTYISGAAAARALGVSTAAVYMAIDRGSPDSVGTGRNTLNSIRVTYDGVDYSSIAVLADALDIKRSILRKRIYDARKKGVDYILNGKPVKIMLD